MAKQGNRERNYHQSDVLFTAKVKKVLFQNDHEGLINFTIVKNEGINVDSKNENRTAKPLFPFLKYTPIVGEEVLILYPSNTDEGNEDKSQPFYLPSINIFNSPNHNIYTNNRNSDKSQYFKEKENITPLLPLEGDFILEGRFGNSIRMGGSANPEKIRDLLKKYHPDLKSNKIPWSQDTKTTSDPITIIKNEQNKNRTNEGRSYIEQIEKDGSSIYLTSTQKIANLDKLIPSNVWPPKSYNIDINPGNLVTVDNFNDLDVDLSTNFESGGDNQLLQNGEIINIDAELAAGGIPIYNSNGEIIEVKRNVNNQDATNINVAQDDSSIAEPIIPESVNNQVPDPELSLLDQILAEQNASEDTYYVFPPDHTHQEEDTDVGDPSVGDTDDDLNVGNTNDNDDNNTVNITIEGENYKDGNTAIGKWPWNLYLTVAKATRSPSRGDSAYTIGSLEHFENLKKTFNELLYPFSEDVGRHFTLTSMYRGPEGSGAHPRGDAVDISCKSSSTLNILKVWEWFYYNAQYSQLIFEFPTEGQEHIHVSRGRANQVLACARDATWAKYLGITQTPPNQQRGIYEHINANKLIGLDATYNPGPGPLNFIPNTENVNAGSGNNANTGAGFNMFPINTDDI